MQEQAGAHPGAAGGAGEKAGEHPQELHGLLADYMERMEAEEEKWRDEIARLECERMGRES